MPVTSRMARGRPPRRHPRGNSAAVGRLPWRTLPYVPPRRLARVRWQGDLTCRVLSYHFFLRWNWRVAGVYARHAFGPFAVPPFPPEELDPPTPGNPGSYSLVATRSGNGRRFQLLYGDYEMRSSAYQDEVFHHLFWHVNLEAMRRTGDLLLVHAGAVVSPHGEGVLLPGRARSGKTSLVAALVRRGFGYLSDEAGAIDPVSRRLFPYPKALAIEPGVFDHFPELRARGDPPLPASGTWHVRPEELRPAAVAQPCELGLVIFPRYGKTETRLTAIRPAEAVYQAARDTMNLSLYGGRALRLLGDVFPKVRTYRLDFRDLTEAVEVVEQLAQS
jgi:hypothetical protein